MESGKGLQNLWSLSEEGCNERLGNLGGDQIAITHNERLKLKLTGGHLYLHEGKIVVFHY